MQSQKSIGSLSHLKVIDMSDFVGSYCSKLFANMGADVTLVEPVGGNKGRKKGPFYKDEFNRESSLLFHYLNCDKKSVILDIEKRQGQSILQKMLQETDIFIEAFPPGYLETLGITYDIVKEVNPKLIWCSITPFGQEGPYSNLKADDATLMSLGGMTYLAGYTDEPPLIAFGEISSYTASLFASVAIMIALQNRYQTETGEYIDISVEECVAMLTETAPQFYDLHKWIRKRIGDEPREPGMGIYPCKDGYILFYAGEIGGGTGWVNLVKWLNDEKVEGAEILKEPIWRDKEWKKTKESKDKFDRIIVKFTKKYTKQELFLEGQKRKIALGPINNAKDAFENEQLNARDFFVQVSQINGENIIGPGAPFLLSETPWKIVKPAPTLGENTREVLKKFGYDDQQIKSLFEMEVV
jgi:benzylsuccinate CoA-transferase BbsE subunit